jgi:hypothetical protein
MRGGWAPVLREPQAGTVAVGDASLDSACRFLSFTEGSWLGHGVRASGGGDEEMHWRVRSFAIAGFAAGCCLVQPANVWAAVESGTGIFVAPDFSPTADARLGPQEQRAQLDQVRPLPCIVTGKVEMHGVALPGVAVSAGLGAGGSTVPAPSVSCLSNGGASRRGSTLSAGTLESHGEHLAQDAPQRLLERFPLVSNVLAQRVVDG